MEEYRKNINILKRLAQEISSYKIYDLSQLIYDKMLTYPTDPETNVVPFLTFDKHGVNLLEIKSGLHAGTHVDAPKHQLGNGEGIDKILLEKFIGHARILKAVTNSSGPIEINDSDKDKIEKDLIVIFYSGWEKYVGTERYYDRPPYISKNTADFLVEKKIKAVGIDMPSVDNSNVQIPVTHRILLKNSIAIIEGLVNLSNLVNQDIFFIGLPLKIKNGDGSMIRAIGIKM